MEWILCEDRLPKNDDWKIVTILDEHGDTPYRYSDFGWYFDNAKCWIVDAEPRTDVIAWMPLPLPYAAGRKTENNLEELNNCEGETQMEKAVQIMADIANSLKRFADYYTPMPPKDESQMERGAQ